MPMEVDHHLMQLIHALRARPLGMEPRAGQMRYPGGAGEGGAAAAAQPAPAQQQQAAEAGVPGDRRFLQVRRTRWCPMTHKV